MIIANFRHGTRHSLIAYSVLPGVGRISETEARLRRNVLYSIRWKTDTPDFAIVRLCYKKSSVNKK